MKSICDRSAFTLIELLVVISIIVLLLSLLAPALDKAIYQAELAVCGANQRTIGTSATTYAFDHSRFYPTRPTNYAWDSIIVAYNATTKQYPTRDGGAAVSFDLKAIYHQYMSYDAFVDPLAGDISLDPSDEIPADDPLRATAYLSYANYHVNSGWGAKGVTPLKQMRKVGDGFGGEDLLDGKNIRMKFPILVSDVDNTARGQGWAMSSHPYLDGSSGFDRFQAVKPPSADYYATWSMYSGGSQTPATPKGDYNYGYADGSVRRENAVAFDDDRMARVIVTSWEEYAGAQRYWQLPLN